MPYAQPINEPTIHIYYEVIGNGEPIVMHHGNGNCVQDWYSLEYVDALKNDFQLILIDSRGYGKSSKPHVNEAYTLKSKANDTIAVLDQLNIAQAHCFGGSIGAAMCFILAKYYPERFKSYIFATPYFTQFNDEIKKALKKGPTAYVEKLEQLIGNKISNAAIRQTFLKNDTQALLAANSAEWFDYEDYISYINKPSLIYIGAKEPSVEEMKNLAKKLPNSELVIIPNLDHAEVYWGGKIVAPIIKRFIQHISAIH